MTPIFKTKKENKWDNYFIKASQFLESARDAMIKGNWNSVGLNAVHVAISANDAVTVYLKNIRSVSEKHGDAAYLLIDVLDNSIEAKVNAKHLIWLVNRKNIIEYEARLFYQEEAEEALKHAERFFSWTKTVLPK